MKRTLKNLLLAGVFALINASASAMPGPSGGPTAGGPPGGSPPTGSPPAGGAPCWNPPCVPIDGGIGLLLVAGALIGARRIYKGNSEQPENVG